MQVLKNDVKVSVFDDLSASILSILKEPTNFIYFIYLSTHNGHTQPIYSDCWLFHVPRC